jgi:hypothetical protein
MAEIDLVSSHTPWTPYPHMIGWEAVGDGWIYTAMAEQGKAPDEVWPDQQSVKNVYGKTVEYSLQSVISFVETYGDDNLVLILLGDHQPSSVVSGRDASHDVPVTVISRDPTVSEQISSWGWQAGMNPNSRAPVWPMDSFRDRFLAAFGPSPGASNGVG